MAKAKVNKPSKTYLELITDVVRNQKISSMELFGVEQTWAGFGPRVRKGIEDETGEPAPEEILGVKIEYSEY